MTFGNLQRSGRFRRRGSSGQLVWDHNLPLDDGQDDNKLQQQYTQLRPSHSVGSITTKSTTAIGGGGRENSPLKVVVQPPDDDHMDPPPPPPRKLPICGFSSLFGNISKLCSK